MAFRWDLLKPTKTTLQRDRAPTSDDSIWDYPVIWVYTSENLAWLLKDGTIQTLPPTSGTAVIIPGVSATEMADLEAEIEAIKTDYMKKSDYDTDADGVVDEAESVDGGSF